MYQNLAIILRQFFIVLIPVVMFRPRVQPGQQLNGGDHLRDDCRRDSKGSLAQLHQGLLDAGGAFREQRFIFHDPKIGRSRLSNHSQGPML